MVCPQVCQSSYIALTMCSVIRSSHLLEIMVNEPDPHPHQDPSFDPLLQPVRSCRPYSESCGWVNQAGRQASGGCAVQLVMMDSE